MLNAAFRILSEQSEVLMLTSSLCQSTKYFYDICLTKVKLEQED